MVKSAKDKPMDYYNEYIAYRHKDGTPLYKRRHLYAIPYYDKRLCWTFPKYFTSRKYALEYCAKYGVEEMATYNLYQDSKNADIYKLVQVQKTLNLFFMLLIS